MSEKALKMLNHWAKNDPNPNATLDLIKAKLEYRKKMVRENPMKLFKELDYEGWKQYPKQVKYYRNIYQYTNGYSKDGVWKDNWMVPTILWNIDPEYWHDVTRRKKDKIHTEFLISQPKANGSTLIA